MTKPRYMGLRKWYPTNKCGKCVILLSKKERIGGRWLFKYKCERCNGEFTRAEVMNGYAAQGWKRDNAKPMRQRNKLVVS